MIAPPKICSRCGTLHQRAQRYCAPCHAEYMRQWRQDHPHLTDKPRARKALLKVLSAVLSTGARS